MKQLHLKILAIRLPLSKNSKGPLIVLSSDEGENYLIYVSGLRLKPGTILKARDNLLLKFQNFILAPLHDGNGLVATHIKDASIILEGFIREGLPFTQEQLQQKFEVSRYIDTGFTHKYVEALVIE